MPIESGTYISDLQPDWPTGQDPESAGDDHLRLLKQTIKNTFPNINGAITATQTSINNVANGINFTEPTADINFRQFWFHDPIDGVTPAVLSNLAAPMQGDHAVNLAYVNNTFIDFMYPIGAVYMNTNGVFPSFLANLGHTWVPITGTIYGAGTVTDRWGNQYSIPAGNIVGDLFIHEESMAPQQHTLAMDAVGDHYHLMGVTGENGRYGNDTLPEDYGFSGSSGASQSLMPHTSSSGGHTPSGSVAFGTQTTAFMSPGRAVYVWERTA